MENLAKALISRWYQTKALLSLFCVGSCLWLFCIIPATSKNTGELDTLSEHDFGYKLLETIQRGICSRHPTHECTITSETCTENLVGPMVDEVSKQEPGKYGRQEIEDYAKTVCGVRGSPYELTGFHWFLQQIYNSLLGAATAASVEIPKGIIYGVLPVPAVNAEVQVRSREGVALILINIRFIEFAHEFSKLAAAAIPYEQPKANEWLFHLDEEKIIQKVDRSSELRQRLAELINVFLDGRELRKFETDHLAQSIARVYSEGIETFAFAHEIGHLYYGHPQSTFDLSSLEKAVTRLLRLEAKEAPLSVSMREVEADIFAIRLLLAIRSQRMGQADRDPLDVMLLHSVWFYFNAQAIIDDARYVVENGDRRDDPLRNARFEANQEDVEKVADCALQAGCRGRDIKGLSRVLRESQSHPSHMFRADVIVAVIRKQPVSQGVEDLQWSNVGVATILSAAILWDQTRPAFLEQVFRRKLFKTGVPSDVDEQ